jgi:CRISPR/Cas system-associated exonuclease Cas4 (RecB family)
MALEWAFSTHGRMRRCQRQLFFGSIAAWHNAKDPLRRESFLLSQVKSMDAWRGNLVHQAIQSFVVPRWQSRQAVPWDSVIQGTRDLGARQFAFSEKRRYREVGMSKSKAGDEYCALFGHEFGIAPPEKELEETLNSVERSLRNLAGMEKFLAHVVGRNFYRSETAVSAEYNGVRIQGVIDLVFSGAYGHYGVVDWKDYSASSTTEARLQMSLYAWLLCKAPTWRVSQPENIELWEINLGLPSAQPYHLDQSDFDELEDFLYRSTEALRALSGDGVYRAGDLENYEYTENPNSCRFCPYQNVCREPESWTVTGSTSTKSKTRANTSSATSLFGSLDSTEPAPAIPTLSIVG